MNNVILVRPFFLGISTIENKKSPKKFVPEKEAPSKRTQKRKKLMTSKTNLFAESPQGFRSLIFLYIL